MTAASTTPDQRHQKDTIMSINTITLSLSTATRTALQAEADAEHVSLERHINTILERRVAHPSWPDRAEAAAVSAELSRVEGERDRARTIAVRLEAENAELTARLASIEVTKRTLVSCVEELARSIGAAEHEISTTQTLLGGGDRA